MSSVPRSMSGLPKGNFPPPTRSRDELELELLYGGIMSSSNFRFDSASTTSVESLGDDAPQVERRHPLAGPLGRQNGPTSTSIHERRSTSTVFSVAGPSRTTSTLQVTTPERILYHHARGDVARQAEERMPLPERERRVWQEILELEGFIRPNVKGQPERSLEESLWLAADESRHLVAENNEAFKVRLADLVKCLKSPNAFSERTIQRVYRLLENSKRIMDKETGIHNTTYETGVNSLNKTTKFIIFSVFMAVAIFCVY